MRRHKRFSQILGVGIVVSLLVVGVGVAHRLIKDAIAQQTNKPLCFPLHNTETRCYSVEYVFSRRLTSVIASHPIGNILASSDRTSIYLWNLQKKQRVKTLKGHSSWVTALAINGNGTLLASADFKGNIKLWQLPSGQLLQTFDSESVTALAFDQTGTVLASASRLMQQSRMDVSKQSPSSYTPIQVWNLATNRLIASFETREPINALALSSNAQWLAAGTKSTKVWHLPSQKLIHNLDSGDLNTLIFNQDATLLLTGSDGVRGEDGIKMWQVSSGKLARVLDSVAADFALSPDSNLLITTYGGTANLWRMKPFGYLGALRSSEYSGLSAEFGLNGNAIALGSSDGVKVWFTQPSASPTYLKTSQTTP